MLINWMSLRKLGTTIKLDLNTYLDYTTNATSYPNIGSLKISTEEERNKMSKELILTACKSFCKRVDTIITKNGGHMV